VLLVILLVIIVALLSGGCNVLKHKQTSEVDSSYSKVVADIASQLKKETVNSETDWWKKTFEYPPVNIGGDTTINNYYNYPTRVIVEGGRNNTNSVTETKDTSAKISSEEKQVSSEQTVKDKQSKPMSLWVLAISWAAWEILKMVVGYFKGKYSIIKK
jgi:uncharacterized protein YceK